MNMMLNTMYLAQALFEVGVENGDPISFYQELKSFETLCEEPLMNDFFTLTYDQFESVEEEISALFSREFTNYLAMLYDFKSLQHLGNIIKSYKEFLVEFDYINEIEIISAEELSDDLKTAIKKKILARYEGDYEIDYTIDKDLIGGLIIRVNDDIYDTSIRSKLQQVMKHGGVDNGKTI